MNLYIIYPNNKYKSTCQYDYYDSAIVAAHSLNEAKTIHPGGDYYYNKSIQKWHYKNILGRDNFLDDDDLWPLSISHISATLIGKAKEGTERGVILASFNAG